MREVPGAKPDIENGCLVLDALTFERASIVALTVGQSAAMEYYERIVDQMFVKTDKIVEKLEKRGTISMFAPAGLHRFIGQAIGTRSEVLVGAAPAGQARRRLGRPGGRDASTSSCARSSTSSTATRRWS